MSVQFGAVHYLKDTTPSLVSPSGLTSEQIRRLYQQTRDPAVLALDANPKDDIGSTVAVSKVFDDDTGVVVITNTNTPDLFGFYKTAATLSTPDVQTRMSEAALNAKQHAKTQGRLNRVG